MYLVESNGIVDGGHRMSKSSGSLNFIINPGSGVTGPLVTYRRKV